ncbi:MAG: 16S rRNA pseudouridine(516) synthase [Betaproteobacteria bacterium]
MKAEQILFSQGFGSRKLCRLLIAQGELEIAGVVCADPVADIDVTPQDGKAIAFSVDGVSWQYHAKAYLMLNKPADYECSQKAKSHPSVYALLPAPLRNRDVQTVGRLDQDTTGLLLFSDDGQFIHRMTSPKHEVPKVYDVTASEAVTPEQVDRLLAGVVLNDSPEPVRALGCAVTAPNVIQLTLTSGKYHQVKRMLAAVGNHVDRLHRSKIGKLLLPTDLAVGKWRWLSDTELDMSSTND